MVPAAFLYKFALYINSHWTELCAAMIAGCACIIFLTQTQMQLVCKIRIGRMLGYGFSGQAG